MVPISAFPCSSINKLRRHSDDNGSSSFSTFRNTALRSCSRPEQREKEMRVVSMDGDEARRRIHHYITRKKDTKVIDSFVTIDQFMDSPVSNEGKWMMLCHGNQEEEDDDLLFLAHVVRNEPSPNKERRDTERSSSSSSWRLRIWCTNDEDHRTFSGDSGTIHQEIGEAVPVDGSTIDSCTTTNTPTSTDTTDSVTRTSGWRAKSVSVLTRRVLDHIVQHSLSISPPAFPSIAVTPSTSNGSDDDGLSSPLAVVLVGIPALDRELVPSVTRIFTEYSVSLPSPPPPPSSSSSSSSSRSSLQWKKTYRTPCGHWVTTTLPSTNIHKQQELHHNNNNNNNNNNSPNRQTDEDKDTTKEEQRQNHHQPILRNLTLRDVHIVNERWEYKSSTSINTITQMILSASSSNNNNNNNNCCVGIEINGVLVAWLLRYLDGPLGMLWCEKGFRRKGFARDLVVEAVKRLGKEKGEKSEKRGAEKRWSGGTTTDLENDNNNNDVIAHAYIVDGNFASEGLFRSLGWERIRSVDWVGFCLRSTSCDGVE